jgi:hypothetical protein
MTCNDVSVDTETVGDTVNHILSMWDIQSIADILPNGFQTRGKDKDRDWQPATLKALKHLTDLSHSTLERDGVKEQLATAWSKRGLGYPGRTIGKSWEEEEANLCVDLVTILSKLHPTQGEQLTQVDQNLIGSRLEEQATVINPPPDSVAQLTRGSPNRVRKFQSDAVKNDKRISKHRKTSHAEVFCGQTFPNDVAELQKLLARIEDSWEQKPVYVIPDSMRKQFKYPDEPFKWNKLALEALCRIADENTASEDLNTLRSRLYESYCDRTEDSRETRELTAKDSENVLSWMKGKHPMSTIPRNRATPIITARSMRDIRSIAVSSTEPSLPRSHTSTAPPSRAGGEVTAQLSPRQLNMTIVQQHGCLASFVPGNGTLFEAKLALSAALDKRRKLETNLIMTKCKRDIEVAQPYPLSSGLQIAKADLAVSRANLEVQQACVEVMRLRSKLLEEVGTRDMTHLGLQDGSRLNEAAV